MVVFLLGDSCTVTQSRSGHGPFKDASSTDGDVLDREESW